MISQKLLEARNYEEDSEKLIDEKERPVFHLSSRVGWMNDPNGFSVYNGEYHLFYQYHPYDSKWGPMHWGHAKSKDLLHWEYLPIALAPDERYDVDGCFSGSALTLPDGRQLLMYTGVRKEYEKEKGYVDVQTQCIAVGNGTDYIKYQNNPVLDEKDLPKGGSRLDFRDPKIWRKKDGTYGCVVGNCSENGDGQILLFDSPDGFEWKFKKILAANNNSFGKMWECPDFFELDGKWILITSPQDMLPEGLEYCNGNGTCCFVGMFDEESGTFKEEYNHALDYGIDFYAPQTVLTPDGRRIMIGWMQNWDTCMINSKPRPWFGQMSLPRELFLKDGRLCQRPIEELKSMHCDKVSYKNVVFSDHICLNGVEGRQIDMEVVLRPGDLQMPYQKFELRFAQDGQIYTALSYRASESVMKIDRKYSGSRRAFMHQRSCRVDSFNGEIKIRLILDRFSAEVFVNDGEQVLTTTLYTDQKAEMITFLADGCVNMDVVKYNLR